MGNCAPTQPRGTEFMDRKNLIVRQDPVWERIRDYSLDQGHFYFAQEFQDIFTEIFGAYIIPDRVAMVVLEFKRYFYLMYKFYTRHQLIRKTKEDPALSYFPQPMMLPPPVLDRMWRLLCSNTRLYQDFCMSTLGGLLDRNLQLKPKLEPYETSRKAYVNQFGVPNPMVWPSYEHETHLQQGFSGFIFMKASQFIEFHQYFEKKYSAPDVAHETGIESRELSQLRGSLRVDVQFDLGSRIQMEPMVDASPRATGERLPKGKTNIQIQRAHMDDEPAEVEDISLTDQQDNDDDDDPSVNVRDAVIEEVKEEDTTGQPQEYEEPEELNLDVKPQDLGFLRLTEDKSMKSSEPPSLWDRKENFSEKQSETSPVKRSEGSPGSREYVIWQEGQREDGKEDVVSNRVSDPEESKRVLNEHLPEHWPETVRKLKVVLDNYKVQTEVTSYFESDMCTSPLLTELIFREYKRFLLLVSLADKDYTFIPSHYIKVAWENHIVQTSLYRSFCYTVFGKFIHSQTLPREADSKQIQSYNDTLLAYKGIFGSYPPPQIWPDAEKRFDYQDLYSFKYFNIFGYMQEVISRVSNKKPKEPVQSKEGEEEERRERRLSIQSMSVSENPSRGKEYISYKQTGNSP